jgi:hypothetical protein
MTEFDVPAYAINFLLKTSQEHLPPRFYQKFLQEGGLTRFADDLPPIDLTLVATEDEVANYMASIYKFSGEGVYALFCQNLAMSQHKLHIDLPIMQKFRAKSQIVTGNPNLAPLAKVQGWMEVSKKMPKIGKAKHYNEGVNVFFSCVDCRYCRAIKSDNMLCFVEKLYFLHLFKWVTGWNFTAEQLKSSTTADKICVIRFTPLDINRTVV